MNKTLTRILIMLLMAGMSSISTSSAAVNSNSGTTSGDFLRLGAGARPTAMGDAFAALAQGVDALYWNPAGLAPAKNRELILAHTLWYMDTSHEYAAYVEPLADQGAVGMNITYLMTTFEKRESDTDTADGNGNVGDLAVGISYGRALGWGIECGLSLKYINSRLDTYNANTAALDVGLRRAFPGWEHLILAMCFSNLGGSLKYIETPVAIGSIMDFGLALQDFGLQNLAITADFRTLLNFSNSSVNVGAEYGWQLTQQWTLSPRIGFKSQGTELSLGFGVLWQGLALDYAFLPSPDFGSTHRLSLGFKF